MFFNSLVPPAQKPMKTLKLCTCIISGSIYSHFSNCSPVTVSAEIGTIKRLPKKSKISFLSAVILIQKAIRKYLAKKKSKRPRFFGDLAVDEASKTLKDAFKELEALKNLASDKSSEVSCDNSFHHINLNLNLKNYLGDQSYEPSDVDTEELLNSSFSSILSRN